MKILLAVMFWLAVLWWVVFFITHFAMGRRRGKP